VIRVGSDLTYRDVPGLGRVAYLLPVVPESAPAEAREGLARRRVVAHTGQCPCGARMVLPNRADRRAARRHGTVGHVRVEHEDDCPATDDRLNFLLGRADPGVTR